MQVLEMEEVESLVGNASRKKLGARNNNNNKSHKGVVAACAARSDFLPKIVVFACVLLLGILFLSAKQDETKLEEGGSAKVGMADVELKPRMTPAPVTAAPLPTEPPMPVPTDPPQPAPTDIPEPSPTDAPKSAPTGPPKQDTDDGDDKEEEEDDDDSSPYGYSKYATILPLIDHPLPDDTTKEKLAERFGRWHFWDGEEENRPQEDYCAKYPNRDVPGDEFPEDAWQGDAVFVNHILNDADQLIARTMEAIFVEYGHGKPLDPGKNCRL
jgi:hypothetical protein